MKTPKLEVTGAGRVFNGMFTVEWAGPEFTYTNDSLEGGPWRVRLWWRLEPDRDEARPCGINIHSDSGLVSAELLRAIPMRDIKRLDIQHMRDTTAEPIHQSERVSRMINPPGKRSKQRRSPSYRPPHAPPDPVIGPRRDFEELERIAKLWHRLRRRGVIGPALVIANEIHLSHSTVRKRIMECRQRGLIPASTRKQPTRRPKKSKR